MSTFDEIRKWLSDTRQEPAKFSVRCDEIGLTQVVQQGESAQTHHLVWEQVANVFAYKRDCFAVDQICIVIGTATPTEWIEVREDDEGYQYLIEQMPIRIVGCPTPNEWWERVVLPPFATQWTQIYPREPKGNGSS
jgi:hypothetical protein